MTLPAGSFSRADDQASVLLHGGVPGIVVAGMQGDVVFVACGSSLGNRGFRIGPDRMAKLPGSAFDDALDFLGNHDRVGWVPERCAKVVRHAAPLRVNGGG